MLCIYCRLEWNCWSGEESMILTMVHSGSQLGQIRCYQQLRVCSKSEDWSGIDRKFKVPSEVNDAHYGWYQVPVRVNQMPLAALGLQWVRRLEWDWQEAQNVPDQMESVIPWTRWKWIESKRTQDENKLKAKDTNQTRWKQIESKKHKWNKTKMNWK